MRKLAAALSLLLILTLSSCGKAVVSEYTVPDAVKTTASGIIAENKGYSLEWDDEFKCAILRSRQTGEAWSTVPFEHYSSGDFSYSLNSPLDIEYYDLSDSSVQTARASECIDDNLVSARKNKDSLQVTYYFSEAEISVTVTYSLREDSLKITLNTSDLAESGKTRLISVSVAPYLCSAANTADRESYLLIPSGSGALMYTDEEESGVTREFSGEVYGADPARAQLEFPGRQEPVRLPVFGVKSGEKALCAIIESGEGAARIDALAGNPRNGYSTAYTTFYVRGFNNAEWDTRKTTAGTRMYKDVILLSKNWPENREFSVGYYPLSGEIADYNGMAACYRDYLNKAKLLEKSELSQQPYHITLAGGAEVQKFTLGIPHAAFLPLTTFKQARSITEELLEITGCAPEALLAGFGKSGLDSGKLAGGFSFAGALGGSKNQKALESFCEEMDIPLFTDFDIVNFTRSGGGFSTSFNTARASDSRSAVYYPLKLNAGAENTDKPAIRLLERSLLMKAAKKLTDFSEGRISGIALSSFGKTAYSDYRSEEYMLKGGLSAQTDEIIKLMKTAGHPVHLSAANAYAAGLAGSISGVPLQNGGYDALDEEIPFYQMIYRGTIPLYSAPVNLSPGGKELLLQCVAAGTSPSFTLSAKYDKALADSSDTLYYGILYENNKELIAEAISETRDFFENIAGAGIQKYKILEGNITQTIFDNGITVTVYHSEGRFTFE